MISQLFMHFEDEWQSQIGIEPFESLPSQFSDYQEEWEWSKEISLENSQVVPRLLEYQEECEEVDQTSGPASLTSLNCIYDFIVTGNQQGLQSEVYYFFNQPSWKLSGVLEPEDTDSKRYAMLAALSQCLVVSFNQAIKRGFLRDVPETEKEREALTVLEEEPGWVAQAPRLEESLVIPGESGEVVSGDNISALFLRMIVGEAFDL